MVVVVLLYVHFEATRFPLLLLGILRLNLLIWNRYVDFILIVASSWAFVLKVH